MATSALTSSERASTHAAPHARTSSLAQAAASQLALVETTLASGRCRSFQQPTGPAVDPARCEAAVEMQTILLECPVDVQQHQLLFTRRHRIRILIELAVEVPHELRLKHRRTHTPARVKDCIHRTALRVSPRTSNWWRERALCSQTTPSGAAIPRAFRGGSSCAPPASPPASPRLEDRGDGLKSGTRTHCAPNESTACLDPQKSHSQKPQPTLPRKPAPTTSPKLSLASPVDAASIGCGSPGL